MLDLEDVDGVLQDREAVEVGVDDDVADVAVHEDLTGLQADDLVRRHAAVGAADPEPLRSLPVGEVSKNDGSSSTIRLAHARFCSNSVSGDCTGEA